MYQEKTLLFLVLPFLLLPFCICFQFSGGPISTITSTQSIRDGELLLYSKGESFVLGFFSPGNSRNRFVGIWYTRFQQQTIVWVANRDRPIADTSGVLSIDQTGNLVLRAGNRNVTVWSSNLTVAAPAWRCSAELLDSGNLVLLVQGDSGSVVAWQSFDYPTNTILPNMKIGVNRTTGLTRFPTSWKSPDDPGTGECSLKLDLNGSPQMFLYRGRAPLWRSGPWSGLKWSGMPEMIFDTHFVDNETEASVMYVDKSDSVLWMIVVNESGKLEVVTWKDKYRRWDELWSAPQELCDDYNHCGAYGACGARDLDGLECKCLRGYWPNVPKEWYYRDWSSGCVKLGGQCDKGDRFMKVKGVVLPDTSAAIVNSSLELRECREMCLKNCSCKAYGGAYTTHDGKDYGCITWHQDLMDIRELSGGQDLYIRVDPSAMPKNWKGTVVISTVLAVVALNAVVFLTCWIRKRIHEARKKEEAMLISLNSWKAKPEHDEIETTADLPFFHLSTIIAATDNFSSANKLGEGGFGSVYKGQLQNGQEVAVKRLSKYSGQGIEEFKNEATLIARLQHRNLVRLLGCCIEKEEKMLVYEYLPNKGLDFCIFDKARASLLDWKKRYAIILGIVRGMLYLHQDSRVRIIHRDLKASNILLDAAMNPKISDFGMARMFGGDQTEANTKRVVGTYGYMSPEYAMEGLFSIKSDVFSFGVLLLEIISGRKNNSYYQENSMNLIGHVWDLWREGNALDMMDSSLGESCQVHEVVRCIHIGLLCVQECATDRPTMPVVSSMLGSEAPLPPPKQPAFIFKKSTNHPIPLSANVAPCSINYVTMSEIEAR